MITTTKNLNEHVANIDPVLIFKEDWMRSVCNQLDNNTESFKKLISDMFDKDFDDASLTLYNSVYNNSYKTKATNYFLKVREKNIINENGVLTFKHSVRTSVIEKCIDGGILGRQIKKKEKQRLIKEKQYMLADNAGIFEYILKVLINGCYGLHLYPGSPFYNVTLAATCTAAARNMVAVASIVIELIEGGWRNYQVQAHLKMIEVCKTMSKEINSKYQLLDCTVEEVLKVMLGDYYETYYAKTALRHALEKVDYDTLKLLYIKNNVYAFMKLPRVDGILKELLRIQKENPTEYIVNPKRDPLYKDLMQELYDMSADILYGFYYYDGDYDNGVYHNTLVDIIENIKRKKIVLMDTDSSVTSFMREVNYVLDTYHGQYDETDDKVVDGSIPSVVSWIYMGCIAKSLFDYVMELGVSPEYAKKVEMEAEHIMEQIQLNLAKKSYAFLPIITDFFMNAKLKLKLKGVSLIKSNFNAEFSAMGKSLLEEKVMVPLEQLNYRDIIMTTKLNTKKAIDILRSDDFILNKRTLLKINSSTLSYSEHKMKSVTLWNMLYPNSAIEFPGSFGVILLNLDDRKIKNIEINCPEEYKVIVQFANYIDRYKTIQTLYKKLVKTPSLVKPEIAHLCSVLFNQLKGKENEYNNEVYKTISNMYSGLSVAAREYWDSTIRIPVIYDDTPNNNSIIDNVKKIALPLDLNEVPRLLKMNTYEIVDIAASTEAEHTVTPLLGTLGIIFTKNNLKRNTVTNIINSF